MARSRSITRELNQLLSENPLPVYVLDQQRQIVYCNPACEAWLGIELADLMGTRCDYHSQNSSSDNQQGTTTELCPPPDILSGQRGRCVVSCRRATGELSRRWAEFLPLSRNDLDGAGAIAVVEEEEWTETQATSPSDIDSEAEQLHRSLVEFRHRLGAAFGINRLVGQSAAMSRVREQIKLAAVGRASVLVVGPTGSGREHVARTIHYGEQPTPVGPLVPVDCRLADAEMIQSAIRDLRRGTGEGPTESAALLLQDVDQMPIDAQVELAGFLQLPTFQLHTICTARHALHDLAALEQFDSTLALALSTLVIELPPLQERAEDVPLLAQCFLEEINARGGRQIGGFSPEALDQLAAYSWPGNLDELFSMTEEACGVAEGSLVTAVDLPARIRLSAEAAAYPRREEETIVLDDFLAEIEVELIQRAVRQAKGNKTKAAQLLGVSRARLHRRLAQPEENDETS